MTKTRGGSLRVFYSGNAPDPQPHVTATCCRDVREQRAAIQVSLLTLHVLGVRLAARLPDTVGVVRAIAR